MKPHASHDVEHVLVSAYVCVFLCVRAFTETNARMRLKSVQKQHVFAYHAALDAAQNHLRRNADIRAGMKGFINQRCLPYKVGVCLRIVNEDDNIAKFY